MSMTDRWKYRKH